MGKATGLAPPKQIVSMKLEVHTLQSISETLYLIFPMCETFGGIIFN